MRHYRRTPAVKRYESSDKGRARQVRYRRSLKGVRAQRLRRQRRNEVNRKIVLVAKSHPCIDCGGVFDPICMDFHHVKGPKRFTIGWGRRSPSLLKQEIAKCIVICANCHRLRHKRKET